VYDSSGNDISITDGEWIIQFGTFGWVGYLSLFGLFALAGWRAMRAIGRETTTAAIELGGLSLMLAINVVDLLPNASMMPVTFLVAGSIARSTAARSRRQARQGRVVSKSQASPALAAQ
jgi:hypothetical protein